MSFKWLFMAILLVATCHSAVASDAAHKAGEVESLSKKGPSVKEISPIFSQLLMLARPSGFTAVFEEAKGGQYIRESVLQGESAKKWSQMITVTGAKGLASNPRATPESFANIIANGFRSACPSTYSRKEMDASGLGNPHAVVALMGCGSVADNDGARSESVLLIVIGGDKDYYTIQWSERGSAMSEVIKFDDSKWSDRLKKLMPIKLCPIVPGEAAPYPSCVG